MRHFKGLVIIVLLTATNTFAAAPDTEPAERPRKATDDATLPEIELHLPTGFKIGAKSGQAAAEVEGLLLGPPEAMGKKIYSLPKSQNLLNHRMTRNVGHSESNTNGGRTETVSGSHQIVDTMDAEWFTWGVAGSDATGFTMVDGVVAQIVLYWKKPTPQARKLAADLEARRTSQHWRILNDQGYTEIAVTVRPVAWYLAHHPNTEKQFVEAMLAGEIVRGMDLEQAEASLGKPFHLRDSGGSKAAVWQVRPEEFYSAIFKDGFAEEVGHTDYGQEPGE